MVIFVFGNGTIPFEAFLTHYKYPLSKLVKEDDNHFLIGDYVGADVLAMEFLKDRTPHVTVYHVSTVPRYMPSAYGTRVGEWALAGGFISDNLRDTAMIEACTHFLGIDQNTTSERLSGTMKNIKKCKSLGKIKIDLNWFW